MEDFRLIDESAAQAAEEFKGMLEQVAGRMGAAEAGETAWKQKAAELAADAEQLAKDAAQGEGDAQKDAERRAAAKNRELSDARLMASFCNLVRVSCLEWFTSGGAQQPPGEEPGLGMRGNWAPVDEGPSSA